MGCGCHEFARQNGGGGGRSATNLQGRGGHGFANALRRVLPVSGSGTRRRCVKDFHAANGRKRCKDLAFDEFVLAVRFFDPGAVGEPLDMGRAVSSVELSVVEVFFDSATVGARLDIGRAVCAVPIAVAVVFFDLGAVGARHEIGRAVSEDPYEAVAAVGARLDAGRAVVTIEFGAMDVEPADDLPRASVVCFRWYSSRCLASMAGPGRPCT